MIEPIQNRHLLKEIVPRLSHLAVFEHASQPGHPQALREISLVADAVGIQVQYLDIREAKDIEAGFQAAARSALTQSLW